MNDVDELIALVEERSDLYARIEFVEQRINELRTRIGSVAPGRAEDPPDPPMARRPPRSRATHPSNGHRSLQLQTAKQWLTDKLQAGPRLWADLADEAVESKIGSRSTLVRARRELGLRHGRKRYQGPVWVWIPGTMTAIKDETKSQGSSRATTTSSSSDPS